MSRDKIVRKATSIRLTKACGLVNKNLHYNIVVIIAQDVAFRRMMATISLCSFYSPQKNVGSFIFDNRAESSTSLNSTSKWFQSGAPQGACRAGKLQDYLEFFRPSTWAVLCLAPASIHVEDEVASTRV